MPSEHIVRYRVTPNSAWRILPDEAMQHLVVRFPARRLPAGRRPTPVCRQFAPRAGPLGFIPHDEQEEGSRSETYLEFNGRLSGLEILDFPCRPT